MASIDMRDVAGKKTGSRDLPAEIFESKVSVPLMHQVVVAGLAGIRAGTHSTKTRGEVRGGGRKPWRQKGTGRSRQGSIRSPHKYKDSREHFQMLTHKRLIDIVDATSKTVQELQRLNLSAGVDIEIKL